MKCIECRNPFSCDCPVPRGLCDTCTQIPDCPFPNLLIGSYQTAKSKTLLQIYGITHIIVCGSELKPLYPDLFTYIHFKIDDDDEQPMKETFDEAYNFLSPILGDDSKNIFIHCYAGVSRSASVLLSILIRFHGISLKEGLKKLKLVRPCVCPNDGFIQELKEYEKIYIQNI